MRRITLFATLGSGTAMMILAIAMAAAMAAAAPANAGTFAEDIAFVRPHTDVVILSDAKGQAEVAVSPRWQGRVLTSTAEGDGGYSFGWLNRDLIASGQIQPHINVFGGEDRFWMGPEGGQFSIFFNKNAPFDLEHWYTPAPFDTEPFQVVKVSKQTAEFSHTFSLTNYSGTRFEVAVDRKVRLLSGREAWQRLDFMPVKNIKMVGYESVNEIRNAGREPWRPETGLLSVWILGQFNPSPKTTVIVPVRPGSEEKLGKPVNSDYFGEVPWDRLRVKDNIVYFKADGQFRSKIGINPRRCRSVLGSYDAEHQILTIVQFSFDQARTNYVNSKWELQKEPFSGDAANSYNDGPPAPGAKPLGPFYELESSSRAEALRPGQSAAHTHRTFHLQGPVEELEKIARRVLGTGLGGLEAVFREPVQRRMSGVVDGGAPYGITEFLREMTNFDMAARLPSYVSHHASSYDRRSKTPADPAGWFANEDWSQFIREEQHDGRREWVLMDADGPGCIVRQWWGGMLPKGTLRFYFDGGDKPEIEGDARELLIGGALAGKPLSIENARGPAGASGGMNLFLPMPFAKHCKVTWDGPNWRETKKGEDMRWYNIEYRTYSPNEPLLHIATFRKADLDKAKESIAEMNRVLANPPDFAGGKKLQLEKKLAPAGRVLLDLPSGPAAVRWLELTIGGANMESALRQTIVRIDFDGEETVWCPAGDFFGSGLGLNPTKTWYRTVSKDGRMTCRWVMPYRESARVTLINLGAGAVDVRLNARVGSWAWDDRSMHFHSNWHRETIPTRPFRDWNYVTVAGRGVYMGDTLALFNPVRDWWGEGDEKIWVDHESFPSHFGTGSEDYYGYSYGNGTLFEGPFSAQPRCDGPGNHGHTTNTRTRNLDAIPFENALKVDMEVWHWADTKMDYAVASYWYALPGARSSAREDVEGVARPVPR